MDFNYLKLVLTDFTLKQLFIIHWLDNKLDKNVPTSQRNNITYFLRTHCNQDLKEWTTLTIRTSIDGNQRSGISRSKRSERIKCKGHRRF